MIVSERKLTVLLIESVSAEVINAGRADTVTSPVSHGADSSVENGIICIDGTAFTHCHVVRGIEGRCSDITDSTRELLFAVDSILRTQSIAVIFYEPEIMLITECLYCLKVERITECMCYHYCLCLRRQCSLELCYVDIVLRDSNVYEYGYRTELDHGSNSCRETCCYSDDLIASLNCSLLK